MRLNDLMLNMCLHEDHMHMNSPWKWGFIHVSFASVPKKIMNILYIGKLLHVFLNTM
jgi:hypothetical protein